MKHYYQAYGLAIGSDILLAHLNETDPAPVDLHIRQGRLPPPPPLLPTKIYRAGLQAQFAQNGPNQLWLDWSPLLSFMAINGKELILDTAQTDPDVLSLFTLSEAIGLILFQKNYFLLHGSAIRLHGKGIIFLGEPGAGKSTTVAAFAQKDIPVLSDDMVCIRLDETGQPFLIPSFPQIKIWGNTVDGLQLSKDSLTPVREGVNKFAWQQPDAFDERPVPLDRIFVLTPPQEAEHSGCQLAKSQTPIELLSYFPLADALLQGQALKNHFEQSIILANAVPVFRMSRPPDFTALHAFVDQLVCGSLPA
ncbi:serine kinase [Spirosoma areae]